MSPTDWLTLVLSLMGLGLGGGALVVALRSLPRRALKELDEQASDLAKLAAGVDALELKWETFREQATELVQTVETKRRKVQKYAERQEQAAEAAADSTDELEARRRARALGFNV